MEECVDHQTRPLHGYAKLRSGWTPSYNVCGAAIEAGQKALVAQPGAVMPDGLIICQANYVALHVTGMICSKEAAHENEPRLAVPSCRTVVY